MELKIRNNTLLLLPQKALFWRETATLVISDLHIGKVSHFRKAGIAVPFQALQNNFDRLDELMRDMRPERIVFTGDVFHSDYNQEWDLFRDWRHRHEQTVMHFVLGNHDRLPAHFETDFNMHIHKNDFSDGPFLFTHHPHDTEKFRDGDPYIICGHIHPVVLLSVGPNQQMRFPCFHFGKFQAVLPSFGHFTGGYTIDATANDMVFAIVKNKLMAISVF